MMFTLNLKMLWLCPWFIHIIIIAVVRTVLGYSNRHHRVESRLGNACLSAFFCSGVVCTFRILKAVSPTLLTRGTGCLCRLPPTPLHHPPSGTISIRRCRFPDGPIYLPCIHTVCNGSTLSGQSRRESNNTAVRRGISKYYSNTLLMLDN
jgi:hypothetical protein